MLTTILFSPSLASTELLRTLAKFGKNTLGLRILGDAELSKTALMRAGLSVTEEYLTAGEQPSMIYSLLSEVPYFASASYKDAENLANAIRTMRHLAPACKKADACAGLSDESQTLQAALSTGEFPEKNAALLDVYKKYAARKTAEKKTDTEDLMLRAIASGHVFHEEMFLLKEFSVTPLEEALIDVLSGGQYRTVSLIELFGVQERPLAGLHYTEGYGAINEVERILTEIYGAGIPLDSCTIACVDPNKYAQIFYDLSEQYQIPVTYGSGVSIVNSNPARLLTAMESWDTTGYHGIDALKKIIFSDAFDRDKLMALFDVEEGRERQELEAVCKMAGSLRIAYDSHVNRERISAYRQVLTEDLKLAEESGKRKTIHAKQDALHTLDNVEKLAGELETGLTVFLSRYTVIRQGTAGRIDQSALRVITQSLSAFGQYAADRPVSEIVAELMNKTVCSEISREGCLHVTSITGAMSAMRKQLYVCGLSAAEFPGAPSENYLLLDNDLIAIAKEKAPTSQNKISQKIKAYDDLLKLAAALGAMTSLSYSCYDLAALKEQNPSSVLFRTYETEHPGSTMEDFRKTFASARFFDSPLSASRLIGKAYAEGAKAEEAPVEATLPDAAEMLERYWSPSALELFFSCPRRFYLARVLGLPEEEPDDPFEVMSAADIGTLAHEQMESLANSDMSKGVFLLNSEAAFDRFLTGRPPLHPADAEREKREFIRMMGKAYDMDPHNEVLSAEESYRVAHPSGIKLYGYPDRVEKDADGNLIIADFKTKRSVEHVENDIDSCFQIVVYAWLCEQMGLGISRCEYRYLRLNRIVNCIYDDEMKEALNRKLLQFKEALLNNAFPRDPGKNNGHCKYCKLERVCVWRNDDVSEEEEDE